MPVLVFSPTKLTTILVGENANKGKRGQNRQVETPGCTDIAEATYSEQSYKTVHFTLMRLNQHIVTLSDIDDA
ncbi:MAG: hypothetical protein AAFX87_08225 [Bacteroidota bacterium]